MTVKKILMAVVMALTTMALLLPVAAGASGYWWYDHDEKRYPTTAEPKTAEPEGDLTITIPASGAVFGPCKQVKVDGDIYNEPFGMGEGTILESISDGENCATSLPGCTILKSTLIGFPWEVTLGFEKEVVISEIEIENHFSEKCKTYGLPATSTVQGSVEGQFIDYVAPEKEGEEGTRATIEFKASPGLTALGLPANLDGFLKFGTKTTAIFKL